MRYVFYITNHGFGHASRNVPIIEEILRRDMEGQVFIKSDSLRVDFLKKNLVGYENRIHYYEDVHENGLLLKNGQMVPDIEKMKVCIMSDFEKWGMYVEREEQFLFKTKADVVVVDIVPWAIKAAHNCGIKSILISNFTWKQSYKTYYDETIWGPYDECYRLADKALWYEIHSEELHEQCEDYECVSLVSRAINEQEVMNIRRQYARPIVFVSLGGSAELNRPIYVDNLPYDFVVTRGVNLVGKNVHKLPLDVINTPDYIAASEYVVAKGGWSTIAEIMLQKKKCALLLRENNREDMANKRILESRKHCITLNGSELCDMQELLDNLNNLVPDSYDMYWNDTKRICDLIYGVIPEGLNFTKQEEKYDTV